MGIALVCMGALRPPALSAQAVDTTVVGARRISVSWTEAPILDVLQAFAVYSGRSIVAGEGVDGTVSADINDRPWDVALQTILETRGLVAVENEHGIIRVEDMRAVHDREAIEPLLTRSYRLSFVRVAEMQAVVQPLLSDRGSVSISPSTNTLVVTDIERVHRAIGGVVR